MVTKGARGWRARDNRRRKRRRHADWPTIQPNDLVTVYHGSRELYLPKLINGFDANEVVKRDYQPSGYRHAGLFVAPDVKTASGFGNSVVLELELPAKFLHGTDYSGRIRRKQGSDWAWQQADDRKKYPDSFRPGLTATMLQSVEPQAILRGLVRPGQVKRVRYKGTWYTRKALLTQGFEVYEPYGPNRPIRDVGYDLSSPRYSLQQFFEALAAAWGVPVARVEKRMMMYFELPEDRRRRALGDLFYKAGFGPTAAASFERKLMRAARGNPRRRARRNTAVPWRPDWMHWEETGFRPEEWRLTLPGSALRMRRVSVGRPYGGVRNMVDVELVVPGRLASAVVRAARVGGHEAGVHRQRGGTAWISLHKNRRQSPFDSPEEGQKAAQDVYLLTASRMGRPEATWVTEDLPPEALVRMDQLLEARGNPRRRRRR